MKILITGSRKFTDGVLMNKVLAQYPKAKFIHGGAFGADKMVSHLFYDQVEKIFYPKYKNQYDKYAPLRRNKEMVETKPDLVIAFYYKEKMGGTRHTVECAKQLGIKVMEYIQE